MRVKAKDWLGTLLVAAIAVPYIGYLIRGEMPFIEDARGMAATGLVLGVAAYLLMLRGDPLDRDHELLISLAVLSALVGVAALGFAETAAAEVLLGVFMASIVTVWAMTLVEHAGVLHRHAPTGVAR